MYQVARPIRAHWRKTISTAEIDDITRRRKQNETIEAQEMGAAIPPLPTLNEEAEVSGIGGIGCLGLFVWLVLVSLTVNMHLLTHD